MSKFQFKRVDLSERKATLFYFTWMESFRELDGDSCKRLITAISDYSQSGGMIEPDFSDSMVLRILFAQIRQQIKHDLISYVASSLKNQINVKVRWNRNKKKPDYDGIEDYEMEQDEQKQLLKMLAENYLSTGEYTTVYDRIDSNTSENECIPSNTTITDKDIGKGIGTGTDTDTGMYVGNGEVKDQDAVMRTSVESQTIPNQNEQTKSIIDDISFDHYFSGRLPTKEELIQCFKTEVFGEQGNAEAEKEAKDFLNKNNEIYRWSGLKKYTIGELVKNWIKGGGDTGLRIKCEERITQRLREEEEQKTEEWKERNMAEEELKELSQSPELKDAVQIVKDYLDVLCEDGYEPQEVIRNVNYIRAHFDDIDLGIKYYKILLWQNKFSDEEYVDAVIREFVMDKNYTAFYNLVVESCELKGDTFTRKILASYLVNNTANALSLEEGVKKLNAKVEQMRSRYFGDEVQELPFS